MKIHQATTNISHELKKSDMPWIKEFSTTARFFNKKKYLVLIYHIKRKGHACEIYHYVQDFEFSSFECSDMYENNSEYSVL